jgi:hypothetical protein
MLRLVSGIVLALAFLRRQARLRAGRRLEPPPLPERQPVPELIRYASPGTIDF